MDVPALIAIIADAILAHCPQYDRVSVSTALESVFTGHPALLGDNTMSMLFGENNDFTHATVTIGDVHAGHTINIHLPQPIDPTLAALIARASLPTTIHHGDMTINESDVSGIVVRDNHGTINQTIHQHQPHDPLPAALAALASIPLDHVPAPRADLPHASRLPFESSPHFVGREDELKQLAAAIGTAQPTVVMPAVATGLGGIGKTSLVTEFAYRYGVYFHGGVFWLNCADPDQIASQIAACAVDLGVDTTGMALDEQVQRVLKAWKSPMPRLIIFDNCEDRAVLKRWKPTVGGCRVLVTSRSNQWPTLTQIQLGLLSPAESRALLKALYADLTDAEADLIATDLGHLPLALHLAGTYLHTYRLGITEYRAALSIAHESLYGHGAFDSPTAHEQNVEATFMLSFNQLDPSKTIDALALGMLDGAAWCAPSVPIPRDLVLAFVPEETTQTAAVDALRRLQQLGLLDGADAVVLHRLLAQVVQARLGSADMLVMVEDRVAAAASRANNTGIPRHMLPLEPHLRHGTMRALDCGDIRAAHLANSLGFFEELRGAYAAAQVLYESALAVHEAVLGPDHPDTATSMSNLAGILERQGRYAEAQGLYERALVVTEAVLGSNHLETATSVNNLAFILERQGRYREAQPLYKRALVVTEVVLGADHPDTATSVNNLAGVLARQGRYREAQPLFERALAVTEAVLGPDHPDTARSMNNLAGVLARQGRYGDAQVLYERALAVREAVLGADHPDTATSMNNLAGGLARQGRYGDAQVLYERALAVHEAVLGSDHPTTATSMNGLAGVLVRQGRYAEAQGLYERALFIKEAVLGADHPSTATSVNNLAGVLAWQGRYGEAQPLFERALAIYEAVLGADHPSTATSMNGLARVLWHQGRYGEAQPLFEGALAVREAVLGADHPDTQQVRQNLAALRVAIKADDQS